MDLNSILLSYIFLALLTLGSAKPRRKIKNDKSVTMSKPVKGFLEDWLAKKPKRTKSTTMASCTSSSSSSCKFPFRYMNRIFSSCTTLDGDEEPWCATSLSAGGQMTSWGYCDSSCLDTRTGYVHPDNAPGLCGEQGFQYWVFTVLNKSNYPGLSTVILDQFEIVYRQQLS